MINNESDAKLAVRAGNAAMAGDAWLPATSERWPAVPGSMAELRAAHAELKRENLVLQQVNASLLASEERLEQVLDGSQQGFWEWDLATPHFWVSERFESMLGYAPGERDIGPEHWPDMVQADDLVKAKESIDRHLSGQTSCHEVELRCRTRSGDWKWILTCGRIVRRAADGTPLTMSGTHTDITARKVGEAVLQAAKLEAEQANDAKSRFLAAASHDLRQPLSALSLYLGVLKRQSSPADAPLLENMGNCVVSLNELLTDLLDLSKLQAGVVTPAMNSFAVADFLIHLSAMHAPEAARKGLRLRCRTSSLTACTDPVLFRRIVDNLIANALRYTDSGGVLVGCRQRQGKAWIEVWDTGIGIPAEKTGEIFEEFRQLGNDMRNRGSGLGLSIVAKAAALLDLQIRVRSQVGAGSLFAIELPLGKAQKTVAQHSPTARPLRIALVEDNPGVLNALVCALESTGHQVVAAASGVELLGLLGDAAPELVISDYRLAGGQTGFDVILTVRQAFGEQLPALLVTGDTDPALLDLAGRGIVVQHKPLDLDALQACMAQLTDRRRRECSDLTTRVSLPYSKE